MKALTLPIIRKQFSTKVSKTIIECANGNSVLTVFANGNQESCTAILANIVVNEIGDTFVATNDSKTKGADGKPLFLKGATVKREKESYDFKSFTGDNTATQFAQGASAFKLQLVVQM